MKTTLNGGGWCVPITVWQVEFPNATGIAICRGEGGEGRKPRWNELEGKLSGGCALSHMGKNVLSVTFFRSVLRGVKGIRSSSEFEISRALGDSTRVGGRSQRWPSVKILHHFCKVNSDASSPPSSHFRQTRKATRFPPRRLDVSPSPL